jgi:hypothetical protein
MTHASRLINRHFIGGLSRAERATMRAHLRECPACRSEYDGIIEILRAAAGREPTRRELTVWQEDLFAQIDGGGLDAAAAARRPLVLRLLVPALASALLVLLCLGLWYAEPVRIHEPSGLRGAAGLTTPLVDLEIFAIRPLPDGGFATPRRVEEGAVVGLEEYVQFRYVNNQPRVKHLYVVGLDSRQLPLDYFPRPSERQSMAIAEALSPRAIPRSIRLSLRHRRGPLWILALFSTHPLAREQVHQHLRDLPVRGTRAAKLATINLGTGVYPVVRRVLLVDRK